MTLTDEQIERYSRQITLKEVGVKGQEKLLNSKVLVIGTGGLGSPAIFYLAGSGVGKIGVIDSERVELNNLHRQIIHDTESVGKNKVDSVDEKIKKLNPDVQLIKHKIRITSENALEIIKDYEIVIDGSDNFPTRYLINDACVLSNIPLVHGGIFRFSGQVMTIIPWNTPCYRCVFPEPPPPDAVPTSQEVGVIGAVAGVIGILQANEVLKYLLKIGEILGGKILTFNALTSEFRTINVARRQKCPLCGKERKITKLIDYEEFCTRR